MSSRHPTVGGKGKPASHKPQKAKPATVSMPCAACKHQHLTSLVPGLNDITIICSQCAAVTNVVVRYDGLGGASVIRGSIEKVERD